MRHGLGTLGAFPNGPNGTRDRPTDAGVVDPFRAKTAKSRTYDGQCESEDNRSRPPNKFKRFRALAKLYGMLKCRPRTFIHFALRSTKIRSIVRIARRAAVRQHSTSSHSTEGSRSSECTRFAFWAMLMLAAGIDQLTQASEPLCLLYQTDGASIVTVRCALNPRWLAMLDDKGCVHLMDRTDKITHRFPLAEPASHIQFDPKIRVVFCQTDKRVAIIRLQSKPRLKELVFDSRIKNVSICASGKRALVICENSWHMISLVDEDRVHTVERRTEHHSIAVDDEVGVAYIATSEDRVLRHDLATGAEKVFCQLEELAPRNANFMFRGFRCARVDLLPHYPSHRLVIRGWLAWDGEVQPCLRVWDLASGRECYRWTGKKSTGQSPSPATSICGHFAVMKELFGPVTIGNLETSETRQLFDVLPRPEDEVSAFSSDSRSWVTFASDSQTLSVWECESASLRFQSRIVMTSLSSIAMDASREVFFATRKGQLYSLSLARAVQNDPELRGRYQERKPLLSLFTSTDNSALFFQFLQATSADTQLVRRLEAELFPECAKDLFDRQVSDLESDSFHSRKRAADTITACGPSALPFLKGLSMHAASANARAEIDRIRQCILKPPAEKRLFYSRATEVLSKRDGEPLKGLLQKLARCDRRSYLSLLARESLLFQEE